MTAESLAAVLWDMDGTLIDSEPYWFESQIELCGRYGVQWDETDGLKMVGQGLEVSAKILQDAGIPLSIPEIIQDQIAFVSRRMGERVPWRPGALDLLAELKSAGIPCAMVTMSHQSEAEFVAERAGEGMFREVVGGDTVERAKPDPLPYREGAKRLGVDIGACVALEDSLPGIASASSSGAAAIAIPLMVEIPESPEYVIWSTLEGRTVADLREVLRERQEKSV